MKRYTNLLGILVEYDQGEYVKYEEAQAGKDEIVELFNLSQQHVQSYSGMHNELIALLEKQREVHKDTFNKLYTILARNSIITGMACTLLLTNICVDIIWFVNHVLR